MKNQSSLAPSFDRHVFSVAKLRPFKCCSSFDGVEGHRTHRSAKHEGLDATRVKERERAAPFKFPDPIKPLATGAPIVVMWGDEVKGGRSRPRCFTNTQRQHVSSLQLGPNPHREDMFLERNRAYLNGGTISFLFLSSLFSPRCTIMQPGKKRVRKQRAHTRTATERNTRPAVSVCALRLWAAMGQPAVPLVNRACAMLRDVTYLDRK